VTAALIRQTAPLLAALFLVGCNGGTVDRHALEKDGETLDSIACEGALVADGVARDRTTVVFTREQVGALMIQSSNLADALASRPVATGIERSVRDEAKRAAALSRTLERLRDHASDRAVGSVIERELEQAGDCP
jgi:hypothetical protein